MTRSPIRSLLAVLLIAASMLGTVLVLAANTNIPAPIDKELLQPRLAGNGNFRYFGLNIYDAQLWVGTGGYLVTAPRMERFALDLRYARALVGKKIAASSIEEIQKLGLGTPAQRMDWQARMEKIFPDVQEGTHITGIYLPNQGARFYRDGKPLGEIMDPEFGYAFFAIWLDPRTSASALRDALLTDAAPR